MMQDDFVRLDEFRLDSDTIADISDDLREVVEKEWAGAGAQATAGMIGGKGRSCHRK